MNDTLVLLKTYSSSFDAHFAKGKLEDAGISSYLFDENTVTLYFFYDNALGGIKLMVEDKDLVAAKEVLFSQVEEENISSLQTNQCPFCKSTNVESDLKGLRSIKSMVAYLFTCILFQVYPVITDKVCICKDCNRSFAPKK